MRYQTLGNNPEYVTKRFRNVSGAQMNRGTVAVLAMNGTDNGLGCWGPSGTTAAIANALFYGVVVNDTPDGSPGDAVASGYSRYTKIVRQTRGASTDSWASEASLSKGQHLTIETVNNMFATVASSGTQASNTTITTLANIALGIVCETLASYASSASATSDTRTAITAAIAVFLRNL